MAEKATWDLANEEKLSSSKEEEKQLDSICDDMVFFLPVIDLHLW
jgi:hypothetical protein